MRPAIPKILRCKLADDGESHRYKLRMPKGRTVFDVSIDSRGFICAISGQYVFSENDIRFNPKRIEDIEAY